MTYFLVYVLIYSKATTLIEQTDRKDDNKLECYSYSSEDDACVEAECPKAECQWYEDSCVIQEITDSLSTKTVTHACAMKPFEYDYGRTRCCKNKGGNKECRLYSEEALSNGDQEFNWDELDGLIQCTDDPPIPTTTTLLVSTTISATSTTAATTSSTITIVQTTTKTQKTSTESTMKTTAKVIIA